MVFEQIRNELAKLFETFKGYVTTAFLLSLIVIEIVAETKLFQRVKTVCIFLGSFLFFTTIAILMGKNPEPRRDVGLSMYEFCQNYGYKLKNETIATEDGYLLTLHRIPCAKNQTKCDTKQRPPVFLMHGLLGSSVDYVAGGPNNSLAFQLADKGYDVWLGNARGNTNSRQHVMLDPDGDSSFWDFSFHEIGVIDLPAMIDHIIEKTKFPKITYVGMSQGTLAYLVMTTTKPEYNDKILFSNFLAPVTTFYNTKNIIFRIWSMFNFLIEPLLNIFGPIELGGDSTMGTKVYRYLCNGPHTIGNYLCTEQFIKNLVGSSDQLNYDMLPFHMTQVPAGASSKQFQHFVQNRISGLLEQYNYYDMNEEHYRQATPPKYDLSKSVAPLAVYYSRGDVFTNVERLYRELRTIPNVVLTYKVPYDRFNHMDFLYAKDINLLVYNKLIKMINQYNKKTLT